MACWLGGVTESINYYLGKKWIFFYHNSSFPEWLLPKPQNTVHSPLDDERTFNFVAGCTCGIQKRYSAICRVSKLSFSLFQLIILCYQKPQTPGDSFLFGHCYVHNFLAKKTEKYLARGAKEGFPLSLMQGPLSFC